MERREERREKRQEENFSSASVIDVRVQITKI